MIVHLEMDQSPDRMDLNDNSRTPPRGHVRSPKPITQLPFCRARPPLLLSKVKSCRRSSGVKLRWCLDISDKCAGSVRRKLWTLRTSAKHHNEQYRLCRAAYAKHMPVALPTRAVFFCVKQACKACEWECTSCIQMKRSRDTMLLLSSNYRRLTNCHHHTVIPQASR